MALTPAQRWGRALIRAMDSRDVSVPALARGALVSTHSVYKWRAGTTLPSYESGLAVAVALDSDALGNLIRRLRTRVCAHCETEYITKWQADSIFCSPRCNARAWAVAKKKAEPPRYELVAEARERHEETGDEFFRLIAERLESRPGRLLAVHQRTHKAMCDYLCGGEVCPDAECPIQVAGMSPYPVAGREQPVAAVPAGSNRSDVMRRRWADPAARQKLIVAARRNAQAGRKARWGGRAA